MTDTQEESSADAVFLPREVLCSFKKNLIRYRKEHKEEQEATEKDVTPKSSLGA